MTTLLNEKLSAKAKKIIALALTAATIAIGAAVLDTDASAAYRARSDEAGYSSDWQLWAQGGSDIWLMEQVGCRSVAYAKLIAEMADITGYNVNNPDDIYHYNVNNGFVTSGYAEYNTHTGKIPVYYTNGMIKFCGKVKLDKTSKANGNKQIMEYINQGYYVLLAGKTHTTYVLHNESKAAGKALISDSWSSWAYSEYANKISYTKYNYASFTNIWLYKPDYSKINSTDDKKDDAASGTTYYVKGTDGSLALNRESRAGTMITAIPENAAVTLFTDNTSGKYIYACYNNIYGWVHRNYVTTVAPSANDGYKAKVVGCRNLALNRTAKVGTMIKALPCGTIVTVYERVGNFYKVKAGNSVGYCWYRYIEKC